MFGFSPANNNYKSGGAGRTNNWELNKSWQKLERIRSSLSESTFPCFFALPKGTPWRRKWQPTPVFLPGESCGQRSLVGCHLWGPIESDMTETI